LDALVQELDVVAGRRVTLSFEVDQLELHLVERLLQRRLLLLQRVACLSLADNVLLDL
jgi:hypothetical protein